MKLAYVAGRYRAPTERGVVENIRRAESVALELWKMGYAVICPHLNTALFGGVMPDDTWLKGDLEMMARCDVVVAIPGWPQSRGASVEVCEARKRNIPVRPWPCGRELLAAEV